MQGYQKQIETISKDVILNPIAITVIYSLINLVCKQMNSCRICWVSGRVRGESRWSRDVTSSPRTRSATLTLKTNPGKTQEEGGRSQAGGQEQLKSSSKGVKGQKGGEPATKLTDSRRGAALWLTHEKWAGFGVSIFTRGGL